MQDAMVEKSKVKNSLWNNLKIRWKLLFIIIPTTILPLVIMLLISMFRVVGYLENRSLDFYITLLDQVEESLNFVYKQYENTFKGIFNIPEVREGLFGPPYSSQLEEDAVRRSIIGEETVEGGLRNTVEESIDGYVFMYEMDRLSLRSPDQNYVMHMVSQTSNIAHYDRMIEDPLFKALEQDDESMVFGKFQPSVISGFNGDKLPAIVYAYYPEGEDTFSKFILVLLHSDFLDNFYGEMEELRFGTLYILDRFNNIISYNHPSNNDYYEFDEETGAYILGDDMPNDPFETLSFNEYTMLNTDPAILQTKKVEDLLSTLKGESDVKYVDRNEYLEFNNKKFFIVARYSALSHTKFIYFHPIEQIEKPIFDLVKIIMVIAVLIILIIVFISIVYSKRFSNPILRLVDGTLRVAQGDYTQLIDVDTKDEIGELTEYFNIMIKNIKSYQDKILSVERERVEMELASQIQTSLLPPHRDLLHYETRGFMKPAEKVGGDYYDIIEDQSGRVWVGIGDVSGHGLVSGLIMMMAQTGFNTILLENPTISTNELIAQVNTVLYQNIKARLGEDHFMTQSFLLADKDGQVKFSGAHEDILVYRAKTQTVEKITTEGVWLGLVPDIDAATIENTLVLEQDDVLFVYTDGLIEAMNAEDEQYDIKRLMQILEKSGSKPVEEIEEAVYNDVAAFMAHQADDITFVVLKKK